MKDDAGQLRSAITRVARQLNVGATEAGLTPTQASALGLISSRGPLGVAALAELEQVNPTMVSRIVGKLVSAGLIHRTPDPDDLRVATIEVTDLGREVHEQIRNRRTAEILHALEQLTPEQAAALSAAIPALEALGNALRTSADSSATASGARP